MNIYTGGYLSDDEAELIDLRHYILHSFRHLCSFEC